MDLLEIPRLIDISGVRANVTIEELDQIISLAKQHRFICAFAMPCFTKYMVDRLQDEPDIMVGGVVGFPSGADTTFVKVADARDMIAAGVDELDMVINVGALKSGRYEMVESDIRAVVEAAGSLPVKVILEVAYLTDEEIVKGARIAVGAGARYVKTGTGWAPRPTTVDHIRLIKSAVGDDALIKAAGGVRDLDTLLQMVEAGCSRFGIGVNSIIKIMDEVYRRAGVKPPPVRG